MEQDLLIDMISWLGEKYGFNVLVKKHPRINYEYFYVRPKNTYDQMIRHKNVFLLDEKVNSSELINNSLAVASITGSLCWEAFLRGKP